MNIKLMQEEGPTKVRFASLITFRNQKSEVRTSILSPVCNVL